MQAYKKRAKGSWTVGKGCKGDDSERQYSKTEIKQQLAEDEENYLDRYHKGKRSRNEKARLEYRVRWYAETLSYNKNESSWCHWLRDSFEKAKKELAEFENKAKITKSVK